MKRVIFPEGQQKIWINGLLKKARLSAKSIAESISVHPRTFSDWKRGEISLPLNVFEKLCDKFDYEKPDYYKTAPQYWYVYKGARKGALKRLELYGPPGTPEGRRKGGIVSQQRRRENPEKYRSLGCNVKKDFPSLEKSGKFAEIVGIILGDGGITPSQVRVTLDKRTDNRYALFVSRLFKSVFGEKPVFYERKNDNAMDLCISGTGLVERLRRFGLESGNKVHRQVDFPKWIWEKNEFQTACVRGLMDTDGCFYSYRPTNRKKGRNFAICFRNCSKPLLLGVAEVLSRLKIVHTHGDKRVNIYSIAAIQNYFETVGSSNSKHREKYFKYFEIKGD